MTNAGYTGRGRAKNRQGQNTVTNFLRLLKLPEKIKDSLRKDEISMDMRGAHRSSDEKVQLRLHEKIVRQGLSVRMSNHL